MRILPSARGRPTYPGKGKPSRTGRTVGAPLTPRQKMFILYWMVRRNSTRAYMDAYPDASYETARTEGSKLFRDPRITSQLRDRLEAEVKRLESTQQRITETLAALAFSNLADIFAADGSLPPLTEIPREVALAVRKIRCREIVRVDPATGERQVVRRTVEVELHDKAQALRLLGVELGMFTDKVVGMSEAALVLALLDAPRKMLARARSEHHVGREHYRS